MLLFSHNTLVFSTSLSWTGTRTHSRKQKRNISTDTAVPVQSEESGLEDISASHVARIKENVSALKILTGGTTGGNL
jgi:hypothetical protein